MNQLSRLLYWGNVAGDLGQLFVITGIILLLIGVTTIMYQSDSNEPFNPKWPILFFCLSFIFWFGAVFMPSQTTVYAIAASQVGEQALKSPVADKATQALTMWLDKQIGDNKKEDRQ